MQLMSLGEVKANGDNIIIEGLANKNVIDRGNDIIDIDAWELDNFKKNPVILYNHGMDPQLGGTPIGRAVEVKPTKDGLMIKAQLSGIDDPVINRIRGLVKERILRAFSVGFDPKVMNRDEATGANRISKAELFEVSIVGVPMNQDSLFNLTGKMMARKSVDALKKDVLKRKGALLASELHAKISELAKEGVTRDSIIDKISELSDMTEEEFLDILAGNTEVVSEESLSVIAEALGLDKDMLKELNGSPKEENEDKAADEGEEEEATKPESEIDPAKEENDEEIDDEIKKKQAEQGVGKNDSQISAANSESDDNEFGSPFLAAMNQTNVLLGTLINEMQMMNSKLDGIAKLEEPEFEEEAEEIEDEEVIEEESKSVDDGEEEDDKESEEVTKARKALELKIDRYAKRLENVRNSLD